MNITTVFGTRKATTAEIMKLNQHIVGYGGTPVPVNTYIGEPQREIIVEPLQNPLPERPEEKPAEAPQREVPTPKPEEVPV